MRHSATFTIEDENEFRLMTWNGNQHQWLNYTRLKAVTEGTSKVIKKGLPKVKGSPNEKSSGGLLTHRPVPPAVPRRRHHKKML